jgi:hypothetical protein
MMHLGNVEPCRGSIMNNPNEVVFASRQSEIGGKKWQLLLEPCRDSIMIRLTFM